MWALLFSIPTMIRVIDQVLSLGHALYKAIKDEETKKGQRDYAKEITDAVHAAVDTKDTSQLEKVLNSRASS